MRKLSSWMAGLVVTMMVPALAFGAFTKEGDAQASFLAVGPAGLKIEGKTSELDVTEAEGKLRVGVALSNRDTGISLRNKHMREKYLDVAKFPRAELLVDRALLKLPADGSESTGTAIGQMTIHGQTKPVTFQYSARRQGGVYAVAGSTRVNMKEFGVEVPTYLGVTVKPDVDVAVRFNAAER